MAAIRAETSGVRDAAAGGGGYQALRAGEKKNRTAPPRLGRAKERAGGPNGSAGEEGGQAGRQAARLGLALNRLDSRFGPRAKRGGVWRWAYLGRKEVFPFSFYGIMNLNGSQTKCWRKTKESLDENSYGLRGLFGRSYNCFSFDFCQQV